MRRWLPWFASLLATSCGAPELYARLGLEKTATSTEIRRSYHAQARHAHPDKVEGDQAVKAAAAEKFKQLAEAYEVLMDKQLRANYDRTGVVPDDRAKASANQQSSGEEDDFGFESSKARQQQQQQQQQQRSGFGRFYESYDAFEVRLAQGRARRARSMETIRKHLLSPNGTAVRHGLIGFYRVGEEALLKDRLKFPYPFAGWSLGREGSGFWWEDELQTFLVPLGASTNEASELSRHFGLTHTSELPAVAWVRKEAALGFALHRPQSASALVDWVYRHLASSLKVRVALLCHTAPTLRSIAPSSPASEPRGPARLVGDQRRPPAGQGVVDRWPLRKAVWFDRAARRNLQPLVVRLALVVLLAGGHQGHRAGARRVAGRDHDLEGWRGACAAPRAKVHRLQRTRMLRRGAQALA